MDVRHALGGRYKLLNELGSGGMAVVWRARDEVLGRPVAVKVLAGRFAGDPQSRARIRDEARAAATLSHPNIAQVYDYGEASEDGVPLPYVVMELVNGPTLQQRVASGPLPPRTIFRICGEVAAALNAAHADGLVHRDIKMANIMVTPAGVKVVDFGIAAVAGLAAPEEMLVGTPAYLAPERLTGDAVEPASDIYALGVLLYRLLADESPWSVESTTQMLKAHVYLDPEPLPSLPGVPTAVAELIDRCLLKTPADRPTASEVAATLGDAAEAAAADAVRDDTEPAASPVPRPSPPPSSSLPGEPRPGSPRPVPSVADAPRSAARPPSPAAGPAGSAVPHQSSGSAPRYGAGPVGRAAETPGGGARPNDLPAVAAEVSRGNRGDSPRAAQAGRARNSSWPTTVVDRAAGGSRRRTDAGVGGAPGVRRKYLLAGGGLAAVTVAALVAWFVIGDSAPDGRPDIAGAPTPPQPIATSASVSRSGPARDNGQVPAATDVPLPGVIAGSGPAPSRAPSRSPRISPSVSRSPAPSATSTPSPSTTQPPGGKRLESPGGVAFATCAQGKATLTGWEPADGFAAQPIEPGPALTARVLFTGATSKFRMAVTCVGDTPTPVVLPL